MTHRPQQDHWPLFFFAAFAAAVLAAFLVLQPGWGFMDDLQGLHAARDFWSGKTSLGNLIASDLHQQGRFRPVYQLWIVLAYALSQPLGIYIFLFALSILVLLGWGAAIARLFPQHSSGFTRYVYPLFFFAFLPLWNVLMYISVQEKFLFLFGSCSFFLLLASYERRSAVHLTAAVVCGLLALLGKETGLALWGTYGAFAVMDVFFWKKNRSLSVVLLVCSVAVGLAYVAYVKGISPGQYAGGYTNRLTVASLINQLAGASLLVKGVGCLALVTFMAAIVRKAPPLFLICPLFVMIYLALLLPWGYPNYLLAPVGPWLMVCVYFWLQGIWGHRRAGPMARGIVAVIVLAVLVLDIVPRIGKMADKRKVTEAVAALQRKAPGRFFYPLPFEETGASLGGLSGADVVSVGAVRHTDLMPGTNYLVVNDEAGPVQLDNVDVAAPVYANTTWRVYPLQPAPGQQRQFLEKMPYGPLKILKDKIYHS